MRRSSQFRKDRTGFTLIELLMAIAILGILAVIAIPGFSVWLPNYSLRSAARDIYSNLQLAKLSAVKQNTNWRVFFDPGVTPGRYFICSGNGDDGIWNGPAEMGAGGDDVVAKTVNFTDYRKGINYGYGNATKKATKAGDPAPFDIISYNGDVATFNSRGIGTAGYVYIANNNNRAYAVGTQTSGVVLLKRWNGTDWE